MNRRPTILRTKNPSGTEVFKVRAFLGYENGKPKFTQRTARTITEAKKIQKQFIAAEANGELTQVNRTTVYEFGMFFIHTVKRGRIRNSTVENYSYRLTHDIAPYLGGMRMTDLKAADIERWMQLMKSKGYSVNTINGARRVLFGICKYAERTGLVHRNQVALTDAFSPDRNAPTQVRDPWTKEEALEVLKTIRGGEFDLAIHIAMILGLRRGELLALTWDDIDFEKGILHVRGTLKEESCTDDEGKRRIKLVIDRPKTANSERLIGLPGILLNAFLRHRDYLGELRAQAEKKGKHWQVTNWVFQSSVGSAYFPSNFFTRYKKYLNSEGIRYIRFHDLRHTTAHLALEHGMNLESLSQTLGHSRIHTTKTIYASKVSKLSIEFPLAFADALIPIEQQVEDQLRSIHELDDLGYGHIEATDLDEH